MNLNDIINVKSISNKVKEIEQNTDKIQHKNKTIYFLKQALDLFTKLENDKATEFIANTINKIEK